MLGTKLTKRMAIICYALVEAYCIFMIAIAPFAVHGLSLHYTPFAPAGQDFGATGSVVFNTFIGVLSSLGYPLLLFARAETTWRKILKVGTLVFLGILIVLTSIGNVQWAFGWL